MLKTLLLHLHRERRRVALAVTLTLVTAAIQQGALAGATPDLPKEANIAAAGLILVPLVALVLPHRRHWIEIIALTNLITAILARLLPGSPFGTHPPDSVLPLNAIAYAAAIWGTRYLIYGRWSDRFTAPRRLAITSVFHSRAPLRDLWYGLIATPGHLDRYADPGVVSADYCDAGHSCVRLVTWQPGSPPGESLVSHDDFTPFKHVRSRRTVTRGRRDFGAGGTTSLEFRDTGRRRVIAIRYEAPALAPRQMLRAWLDDTLGRIMDQRIRAIEQGRVGHRSPVRDPHLDWFDAPGFAISRAQDARGVRPAYGRTLSAGALAVIEGPDAAPAAHGDGDPPLTRAA